jgi:uncharacterized protein
MQLTLKQAGFSMIESLLNIPVLFFVFGAIAVLIKSNLEVPQGMIEGITLYLMLAIGITGGISLAEEPVTWTVFAPTLIVVIGSIIVASYVYWISRRFLSVETSAAIAATYGSNSTMTFITAAGFLTALNVVYGGAMTIALVLMETPAIIYGIYLATRNRVGNIWISIRNAFTDGTHLLLIASLIIGFVTVSMTDNPKVLYGFVRGDIFTGALCFFLLSMGIKVGHALRENLLENLDWRLISMAVLLPWINGALGYAAGMLLGLSTGDLFLTTILMASSSYIVAPAILSKAVPEAEIGKYLTMSIAVTFPMNILIGLPIWWQIVS